MKQEDFWSRLALVFAEYQQTAKESFFQPKSVCFRLNRLKISAVDQLAGFLPTSLSLTPVSGCADCFWIDQEHKSVLSHSSAVTEGLIYIQNPSSILIARCLPIDKGDKVLDLTAAPGGKTSVIAESNVHKQGELWAVDNSRDRFFRLKDNLNSLGIDSVNLLRTDGCLLRHRFDEYFDRILLDAPCSGEARLRASDVDKEWKMSAVKACHYKQKALLSAAWQMLKPGGHLLYATCSTAPEENESVVSHLLKKYVGTATLEPVSLPVTTCAGLTSWGQKKWPEMMTRSLRIVPNQEYDALFLCLLKKTKSIH